MPFAKRRKAGAQRKIAGRERKIEISKIREDIKSMALSGSPVKINIPLRSKRPEQKRMN